jgi:hypothetical protein
LIDEIGVMNVAHPAHPKRLLPSQQEKVTTILRAMVERIKNVLNPVAIIFF